MIKKNIFPIAILLISIAIIYYFLSGDKNLDGVRQDLVPAETTISSGVEVGEGVLTEITKACYLKKTPSTLAGNENLNDIEYVEVSYSEGSIVTGFVSYIPTVSDTSWGTFVGAHNNGFLNVIYSGNAEGDIWEEQVLFKISEEGITRADYLQQIQNEEGVFVYDDVSKVTFVSEVIPQVDCSLVNAVEVGLDQNQ